MEKFIGTMKGIVLEEHGGLDQLLFKENLKLKAIERR